MEQNCTDAMDNHRRYEESVRELSELMRAPRRGIDYRRLYNRNPVEPSGPTLRATLLVGREKWQAEVLLTESGAAIGYTKPHHDPSTGYSGSRRVDHLSAFLLGDRHRLFTEHMDASFSRSNRIFAVHTIRQGNIDRVDMSFP